MPAAVVYEFCTATGVGRDPAGPDHGLYREGRAMRAALAADLAALPGVTARVVDPADAADFPRLAADAAFAVVIAPELGGHLGRLCGEARAAGASLWNASQAALRTASDKRLTAAAWHAAGVPTPRTEPPPGDGLRWPRVGKPACGAGSTATRLLRSAGDVPGWLAVAAGAGLAPGELIVQEFAPGTPASVGFLVGPAGAVGLPPARQHISTDGTFTYTGGTVPAPPGLAARAARLAARAVAAVPGLAGYVGVDLILGDAADGAADVAVEINPRLTTSYVGLRALCAGNLAAAWLAVARGDSPGLAWRAGGVRFDPAGGVAWV